LGLSRNEWIKRALRWQLWDRAGALRLAPVSQAELGKLRKQVLAIGRNINQAVHAMNAANQPGSTLEVARIAAPFLETCGDLKALLMETRRAISSYVGGEVGYWVTHSGIARDEFSPFIWHARLHGWGLCSSQAVSAWERWREGQARPIGR
jgi:hypothetical protein